MRCQLEPLFQQTAKHRKQRSWGAVRVERRGADFDFGDDIEVFLSDPSRAADHFALIETVCRRDQLLQRHVRPREAATRLDPDAALSLARVVRLDRRHFEHRTRRLRANDRRKGNQHDTAQRSGSHMTLRISSYF
jgi:hypothetical protein